MHKLEHAPLVDIEWTEDQVACALAGAAEEGLGFGQELLEMRQMFGGGFDQVRASDWMRGWLGHDWRRCSATRREITATRNGVLKDVLSDGGPCAGRSAFGQASVDRDFGTGVGEEQMLDYLLDAPFVWVRRWAELGLCGIEPVEGGRDLALELMENGVHSGKITLHRSRRGGRISPSLFRW